MDINNIPARSEHELFVKTSCMEILRNSPDHPTLMRNLAKFIAHEMVKDYEPEVFTKAKPQLLTEYESMDERGRYDWDKTHERWQHEDNEVKEYFDEKYRVKETNKSQAMFLQELHEAVEGSEKQILAQMLARYRPQTERMEQVEWDS